MSIIQLHYDGDIVTDHRVSMRTLGKRLQHLQNAVDRAYLDIKFGGVWKYARMTAAGYDETEFLVQEPKEGGYLLKFLSDNPFTKEVIDRVSTALRPAIDAAMNEGEKEAKILREQVENRKNQITNNIIEPHNFKQLIEFPDKKVIRQYGDRSIVKEIDQILAILRSKSAGESTLGLTFKGERTKTFDFDREISYRFHQVVSERIIGEPVIYISKLRSLDNVNMNGKIINLENDKTATLHLQSAEDLEKVHPFLITNKEMVFIGCPLIEYGSFDPQAGDIHFIDLM